MLRASPEYDRAMEILKQLTSEDTDVLLYAFDRMRERDGVMRFVGTYHRVSEATGLSFDKVMNAFDKIISLNIFDKKCSNIYDLILSEECCNVIKSYTGEGLWF